MKYEKRLIEIITSSKQIATLEADQDLIDAGVLDSFDIITLVGAMESEFGISVDAENITPESFSTVAAISAMLEGLESV